MKFIDILVLVVTGLILVLISRHQFSGKNRCRKCSKKCAKDTKKNMSKIQTM